MSRVLCFKLNGLQQTYIELHRRMCTLPDRLDRSTTRLADRPILHLFLDTAPRRLLHGSRALSSVWTTRLLYLLGMNRESKLSEQFVGRETDVVPRLTSISVKSCHLFMATIHLSSLRRQLRGIGASVNRNHVDLGSVMEGLT